MARSDNEIAASEFRKLYFLMIALGGQAGRDGQLAQACDLAEEALVKLLDKVAAEASRPAASFISFSWEAP